MDLSYEIAKGICETGVEGSYASVTCSTAGDYPSVGVSQWEGSRCDNLLSYIDGGSYYAGRTYSDIESAGELESLSELLDSPQGQEAQRMVLAYDCQESYLPFLEEVLTNPKCIIYAGIWCPTSHYVVRRFLQNRTEYDLNNLEVLRDIFRDQYATAASCEDYAEGYANRAENTYEYVRWLQC